jgi:hypothetical protein
MRKESDSNIFTCVICKETRDFYGFGICEHRGVCSICCLRSRLLYNDKKCPICTTKLDITFIYETNEEPSFKEAEAQKAYMYEDGNFKVNIN